MAHDTAHAIELAHELQVMLDGVSFPVDPPAATQLRAKVCEFADELRFHGVSPERAIVAVKDVLRYAGYEASTRTKSTEALLTPRDHLLGDVVSWCIEGYYGDRP
jgi:hypothetical protein